MPDTSRQPHWKWAVCVMLLLATMLNYMDRLTVAQVSSQIIKEFGMSEKDYGMLDAVFSVAFACGALFFGWVVDRWNVAIIYPMVLAAWSLMGAMAGLVPTGGFIILLMCRFSLGLFEAGHWPCALRTTQRILPPAQRTLGNSILQSGAAIGAVLTPLIIIGLMALTDGNWRVPFVVIGSLGVFWVIAWTLLVKPGDLAPRPALSAEEVAAVEARQSPPPAAPDERVLAAPGVVAGIPPAASAGANPEQQVQATLPRPEAPLATTIPDIVTDEPFLSKILRDRRFYLLIIIVVSINSTWHFFRVWLPRLLVRSHGFSDNEMNLFTSAYYLSTDVGSLAAGFGTVWLVKLGLTVHGSRVTVFGFCAALTTLSIAAIGLQGPILMVVLLVIGFGALGLFPPYYSLSQELTVKHQGKLTGLFGFLAWIIMAPIRVLEGVLVDYFGNFNIPLVVAGVMPILGFAVLALFWPKDAPSAKPASA